MKKVTIVLNNDGSESFEDFYANIIENLDSDDLTTLASNIKGLQDNGDLWFKHYYQEGGKNHLTYIFDSADSVTTFGPGKTIIENMPLFESYNVEEMTFEQFANYASGSVETLIDNPRVNSTLGLE